jgi:CubicO group peptidase (beta-lactamase class C family)
VSTDVLGRVVEVVTGQPLDQVFAECIFAPLGMSDTSWSVEPAGAQRLAALCAPNPQTGQAVRFDSIGRLALSPPECLSGGGGLISTAADYHRFIELLRRGGELDGVRLLGNRTVAYMTRNHLPGVADLEAFGRPLFADTTFDFDGMGFGLGFSGACDGSVGGFRLRRGRAVVGTCRRGRAWRELRGPRVSGTRRRCG